MEITSVNDGNDDSPEFNLTIEVSAVLFLLLTDEREIEVYPNPASNFVTIKFKRQMSGGVMVIHEPSGKIIQTIDIAETFYGTVSY